MMYEFAPMEGITTWRYRRIHHELFPGVDRYYTPFLTPNYTRTLKGKERAEVDPGHNEGMNVVPQILANRADEFLWCAGELRARGYTEVNLNLGCPAPMITRKGRGSGFLAFPRELEAFLDAVCEGTAQLGLSLSIKTRLGVEDFSQLPDLIALFDRYPLSELIVHPRTQRDLYRNPASPQAMDEAYALSHQRLGYNGDLFSPEDGTRAAGRWPGLVSLMPARGIIANPALIRQMQGGPGLRKEELRLFHDRVFASCLEDLPGERAAVNAMKELWGYMGQEFVSAEKERKQIRRAQNRAQYEAAVRVLFSIRELGGQYRP